MKRTIVGGTYNDEITPPGAKIAPSPKKAAPASVNKGTYNANRKDLPGAHNNRGGSAKVPPSAVGGTYSGKGSGTPGGKVNRGK